MPDPVDPVEAQRVIEQALYEAEVDGLLRSAGRIDIAKRIVVALAALPAPVPDKLSDDEKLLMKRAMVYRDRCAAVEDLLAHYRAGTQPSERLHRTLARTKKALDRLTSPAPVPEASPDTLLIVRDDDERATLEPHEDRWRLTIHATPPELWEATYIGTLVGKFLGVPEDPVPEGVPEDHRVCSHGIYHHGCPSCDRQDPEEL